MNDDKYIHNAYLNILKNNNIKSYNYFDVYLSFKDDIFIKLLSEHSCYIKNRLNHLKNIDENNRYIYKFSDLSFSLTDNHMISYCAIKDKYIKNINNKLSICEECLSPCCIINIDINDMYKYFNKFLEKNIELR